MGFGGQGLERCVIPCLSSPAKNVQHFLWVIHTGPLRYRRSIVMADLVRHRVYKPVPRAIELFRILRYNCIDPVAAYAAMTNLTVPVIPTTSGPAKNVQHFLWVIHTGPLRYRRSIVMADLVRHRVYKPVPRAIELFRILRYNCIDPVAAYAAMTILWNFFHHPLTTNTYTTHYPLTHKKPFQTERL